MLSWSRVTGSLFLMVILTALRCVFIATSTPVMDPWTCGNIRKLRKFSRKIPNVDVWLVYYKKGKFLWSTEGILMTWDLGTFHRSICFCAKFFENIFFSAKYLARKCWRREEMSAAAWEKFAVCNNLIVISKKKFHIFAKTKRHFLFDRRSFMSSWSQIEMCASNSRFLTRQK